METVRDFLSWFMPLMGFIQLFSGVLLAVFPKRRKVRRHYLIYLAGVLLYFLLFSLIINIGNDPDTWWQEGYFFGGAGFLMCYHLYGLTFFKRMTRD